MSYITDEMVDWMLKRMVDLETNLNSVYSYHGLKFRENTGRRNATLSHMQEIALAEALNRFGEIARVDGRTGYPDVCVDSRHREIECKLTSGSGGSWSLQADYSTLERKGSLDFLYILADEKFESFAVLFFEGLSCHDFHPPSSGSREKARMNKISAMEKCTVLAGRVTVKNERMVIQYCSQLRDAMKDACNRLSEAEDRIIETTAPKKLQGFIESKERLLERSVNKIEKISEKIVYWRATPLQFTIELEKYDSKDKECS